MESSTVYIGSIPFDQTEEQVMEIARSIGPVTEMKLLFDPLTGKSKGHAFVKYSDHETAASAVRNLNNFLVGTRALKCSLSSEGAMRSNNVGGDDQSYNNMMLNNSNMNSNHNSNSLNDSLPPLPPGMALYQNQTPQQAVFATMSTFDPSQLFSLMIEAKKMCKTNPALAKQLLEQYPQLSHALVECSLKLQLTNPDLIQLCLNNQNIEIDSLNEDQQNLLKSVYYLSDSDLNSLSDEKRSIFIKIKQEIEKGSYGKIVT